MQGKEQGLKDAQTCWGDTGKVQVGQVDTDGGREVGKCEGREARCELNARLHGEGNIMTCKWLGCSQYSKHNPAASERGLPLTLEVQVAEGWQTETIHPD